MQESEEIVKKILIEKGYKVWREGDNGMPDFKCVLGNRCFFLEVKTKNDGLHLNQLKCISRLLEEGNKVYLCYYEKGNELELFEITTILQIKEKHNFKTAPGISARNFKNAIDAKLIVKKCEKCGYEVSALTEAQANRYLSMHKCGEKQ